MERLHRLGPLEDIRKSVQGSERVFRVEYRSAVGPLTLIATDSALVEVRWGFATDATTTNVILDEARRQLDAYFAGRRRHFDLSLEPYGTAFQKRAWDELKQIPFGEVITYAEQAKRLGMPNACRAVGAANGRNPLCIFVPCHRVVGANRQLTGFAGGIPAKARLLELEGVSLGQTIKNTKAFIQTEWSSV